MSAKEAEWCEQTLLGVDFSCVGFILLLMGVTILAGAITGFIIVRLCFRPTGDTSAAHSTALHHPLDSEDDRPQRHEKELAIKTYNSHPFSATDPPSSAAQGGPAWQTGAMPAGKTPEALRVVGSDGADGLYVITALSINRFPMWKRRYPSEKHIFSSPDGFWRLTDHDTRDFLTGGGFYTSSAPHASKTPDTVTLWFDTTGAPSDVTVAAEGLPPQVAKHYHTITYAQHAPPTPAPHPPSRPPSSPAALSVPGDQPPVRAFASFPTVDALKQPLLPPASAGLSGRAPGSAVGVAKSAGGEGVLYTLSTFDVSDGDDDDSDSSSDAGRRERNRFPVV